MIEMIMERKKHSSNGSDPSQHTSSTSELAAELPEQLTVELVQLFKLLSDETRLRVLMALLYTDEMHVRALCDLLSQSQPAVSHHLALLKEAGLIDRRREGKHNFYHLVSHRFEALLKLLFSGSAAEDRELHFKDYVLSYSPAL